MNAVYQNLVVMTVIAGLPCISWAVSGPRRNSSSLLFLLGMSLYAVAAAVFLFKPDFATPWIPVIIRSLVYAAILLINEYLRRVIDRKRLFDTALWAIAIVVVLLSVTLEVRFGLIGVVIHHAFMVVLQLTVLGNMFVLYRQTPSRGLISMGAAMIVVLLTNISQVLSGVFSGVALQPDLEGVPGLLIYLANLLWVMLFSIGYWAYHLDCTKKSEMHAEIKRATEQQGRKTAESLAEEMSKLIRQRDELIMINTRFETLNNVGVFNAAVIHELSQPVQKILTKIEYLTQANTDIDGSVQKILREIRESATTTGEIIHAVRSLLLDTPIPATFVPADDILSVVRPIIDSQAKADRVWLSIEIDEFPSGAGIVVNPVLLNRVILNLSSNALAALRKVEIRHEAQFAPRLEIRVKLDTTAETDVLRIEIWDNGSGFPKHFDSTLRTLSKASNSDGMGLGLVLSRQIMATWRGTMSVTRRDGGTEVSCSIPLALENLARSSPS